MRSSAIFLLGLIVLLMFNVAYYLANPETTWTLALGAITGLIASALAVGIISGIQILGSGLNSASIKIIFGVATILNILFSINISGFQVGMGLASNMIALFPTTDLLGTFGFLFTTIFSIVVLVGGLITVIGGSD